MVPPGVAESLRSRRPRPDRPRNWCSCYGEDFSSVRAYDRHRTGSDESLWSLNNEHGRRCMDAGEVRAVGMNLDGRGRWLIVSEADRVRERFAG